MKKKNKNEEKPQMKKFLLRKKPQMKEKPQVKKTNVEHFKEVTHEIEFTVFSELVLLTIIRCGKLIGYEKARDLLHKYVYLLFCKLQLLFKKPMCHLRHEYL